MTEELMEFEIPQKTPSIIKVIGVGGGGNNAVNYMYKQGIKDVDFIICNTDSQALDQSTIPIKIQLGDSLTEGLGAGNKPERGKQAAIENIEDMVAVLGDGTKMVFITAGMGGGTGTGAAPVVAKAAKDMGILTVGIVTIPFRFEGRLRINQALDGVEEMRKQVDSLLVINNEKLREIYGDLKLSNAFSKADDVLTTAAKGIAEIITVHGYINVDFADVQTVMKDSGVSVMGSASAEGEGRALNAIKNALVSPLLNNNDIRGAKNILLNITSGDEEITMDEVGEITDFVQDAVGDSASIIWGTGTDETLGEKINVTIIATGFSINSIPEILAKRGRKVTRVPLDPSQPQQPGEPIPYELQDAQNNEVQDNRTIDFNEIQKEEDERIKIYYAPQPIEDIDNSYRGQESVPPPLGLKSRLSFQEMEDDQLIEKLESTPAYKRKRVKLKDNKTLGHQDISKFSINDDGTLQQGNSFLYDQPD